MNEGSIAVIGGSGFIGRHLAARLARQGLQLGIATRQPDWRLRALQVLPGVSLDRVDLADVDALARWLEGRDAVVSMAGILHGSARAFHAVHAELPARIVDACHRAGVGRIVHVSALGAAADAPSHYQQSKAAGEDAIRAGGLCWTILRPSVVFGPGDNFLNLFAALCRRLPVIPLAGAEAQFQPVWVEDVARATETVLPLRTACGRTLDLAGPNRYTLAELVRLTGRMTGHPRPILPLPSVAGLLQATLFECLPGPTLMSRDNVRSLARDNISETGFPARLLGFAPTSLETVAPSWLKP
jgi:uncharacterized protein YbjT (DUF2867 family)